MLQLKPEHHGFRAACRTLYGYYARNFGLKEGSLDEHLYDEYFMHLDVTKGRFTHLAT